MTKIFLILASVFLSASVLANEKSLYKFSWLDKDKEIYVLQNRKYRKDGKVYVGLTGVKTLNGSFIDSMGGTARAGYFFSEDWGLEFVFGKNSGSLNNAGKGVKEQGTVPFYRKIDSYTAGMLVWSPFYSKINTFNQVFYFDWTLGAGVASIRTQDNRNAFDTTAANTGDLTAESVTGGIWNSGFRFYISEHWSLRMDITGLHYKAAKTRKIGTGNTFKSNQMFSTYDFGVGLNYAF